VGGYNKGKYLAKRLAARVHQNLNRAASELAVLYGIFEPHHKEEAEVIDRIGQGVMLLLEEVEALWQRSWGELPEDWGVWT
jgi:hypothetical protein